MCFSTVIIMPSERKTTSFNSIVCTCTCVFAHFYIKPPTIFAYYYVKAHPVIHAFQIVRSKSIYNLDIPFFFYSTMVCFFWPMSIKITFCRIISFNFFSILRLFLLSSYLTHYLSLSPVSLQQKLKFELSMTQSYYFNCSSKPLKFDKNYRIVPY